MDPHVDYDTIADAYDRRYLINDYSGVEQALSAFAGDDESTRVLEVGCGTGHWLRVLRAKGVRTAGLDASLGMLTYARAKTPGYLVQGVSEQLPWATASFDRVFCVNAIHHFQSKERFIAEAHRVLTSGGQLMTIGLDPHAGTDQWYVYDYFETTLETDKRRYPSAAHIREWMRLAGFVDCVTREVQHRQFRQSAQTAFDLGRLEKSATSQLAVLTDEEYDRGIERIRTAMQSAAAAADTLELTADLRLYSTCGSVPS